MAFMMMASSSGETSGFTLRGEGMSPMNRCLRMVSSGIPFHGRAPVAASQRSTPTAKMSARRSIGGSPRACSGAMYETLPLTTPALVSEAEFFAFAMPKSTTFTAPS